MKRMNKIVYFGAVLVCFLLSSCTDYLNIAPKGNKIPTTLADFEALLRDQYTISRTPVTNALYLLNDVYLTNSQVNTPSLSQANYMWDESADRIMLNNADEGTYYVLYGAISSCNLIVENVPTATEATDAERNEVIAYAKVIRALCYDVLVNYYADTYDASTAAEKRSVPLLTSADIDAPYTQVSIQAMYDFIIQDVKEAIEMGLPAQSMTAIHPNLGAGYALLARVYLQMQNYSEALRYANLALAQNDQLYDWNTFYEEHKAAIEDPDNYDKIATPMQYDYVENYYLRLGEQSVYDSYEKDIPVERAARFEEGDARFLSRWKLKVDNNDTYYKALESGYFNHGGLTTCEAYLIKAECQARLAEGNDYSEAMNTLNAVRITRIRSEVYCPAEASTLEEALSLIRRTKDNELIFSIVPFADARRFNLEGTYASTLIKTYEGKEYSLSPTSHLWTMPFPAGALNNPGNGSIEQNVSK
jgi:hypothetical protein